MHVLRSSRSMTATSTTGGVATSGPAVLDAGTQFRQYELISELGRGGMGVVYAARDTRLGRRVAIKVLRHTERHVVERFLAEARATAACTHENIVVIHEVDEHEGMPYMVLEFLEGRTLRDVIDSEAPLLPRRAIDLMLPIARALVRAHELGIIHRDLKPENVFVTRSGQLKVLDFGIAKALGTSEAHRAGVIAGNGNLTQDHGLVGTPAYMSPEQMSAGEADQRTDLWACGIILFELLTATHPINAESLQELLLNAASDDPMPSLGDVAEGLPGPLVQLVDACLRKPMEERIPNATVLVDSLERLQRGRGKRAPGAIVPYPGLVAFQEDDAERFFGRSRDIERMLAQLRERAITGVVGPSGAGKSSFVRAGVGPALKQAGRWDVVSFRPGRHPMTELANVALAVAGNRSASNQERHTLRQRICDEPGLFGALLRKRARGMRGRLLLFVDQFEELYTLTSEPAKRSLFLSALAGVADFSSEPLRVLISIRSDFLDRVAEDARFMDELSRGLVFLGPPDRADLREALVSPLELAGYRFETPDMVDAILDALGDRPGALPLLQFAAARLWEQRDEARRVITETSFEAIGGISGALSSHADDVLARMDSRARHLTRELFRALVTPERTRAIVERTDLAHIGEAGEVDRVVDDLVAARLLVVQQRDEGGSTVEIVHESLIARWPALQRWLDEDRDDAELVVRVVAAAKQWDAQGRSPDLLWRGEVIEDAARRDRERPQQLAGRERAFLDAGIALARRSRRRKRFAVIGTIVALAAISIAVTIAVVVIGRAEQAATAAEQEAVAARGRAEHERANADQARRTAEAKNIELEAALADKRVAETGRDTALEDAKRTREETAQRLEAQAGTFVSRIKQAQQDKIAAQVEAVRQARSAAERSSALGQLERLLEQRDQDIKKKQAEVARAQAAAAKARAALDEVNRQLQRTLASETARIKQLEAQIKDLKLSTHLK